MPVLPSYGSLTKNGDDEDGTEPNNRDASFNEENTYYLKNSAPLSTKKVLLLAVPILGAALLMGGIVLFLLRDFGHLYPGRGGDRNPSPDDTPFQSSKPVVVAHSSSIANPNHDDDTIPHHSKKSSNTNKLSASECAAHSKCAALIGQCCPTMDGVELECCNN